MLFKETFAVYCENHTEHTDTFFRQNAGFYYVKACGSYSIHWALNGYKRCRPLKWGLLGVFRVTSGLIPQLLAVKRRSTTESAQSILLCLHHSYTDHFTVKREIYDWSPRGSYHILLFAWTWCSIFKVMRILSGSWKVYTVNGPINGDCHVGYNVVQCFERQCTQLGGTYIRHHHGLRVKVSGNISPAKT
jgi:hypothetical protein